MPMCCPRCGRDESLQRFVGMPGQVFCSEERFGGCGWHGAEEDLAPPAYVRDLLAQREADDAWLLELEWCDIDIGYNVRMCYCCEHHPPDCKCKGCNDHGRRVKGHADDCDMKRRCDEARARRSGGAR